MTTMVDPVSTSTLDEEPADEPRRGEYNEQHELHVCDPDAYLIVTWRRSDEDSVIAAGRTFMDRLRRGYRAVVFRASPRGVKEITRFDPAEESILMCGGVEPSCPLTTGR